MGKYPYASTSDRTELQRLNDGYVIKRGRKGVEKYTSESSQHTAIYYGESDVKKRLDDFRTTAKRNIPIRTLVSAIVMAILDENESKLKEL